MSEENIQEISIEAPVEEVKVNPTEDEARSKGWRPQDEYNGNPEDFVSAKEYLRVGEMIDRQKYLEKQVHLISKQNQDMYKKFSDARVEGYNRAIEDLKFQRKEALELGDADTADKISEQMDTYKKTVAQEQQQVKQNSSPDITDFLQRNSDWFNVDQKLTKLAIIEDQKLRLVHPEKSDSEIFKMVEDLYSPRAKKATGDRLSPPPVATPSRSSEVSTKTKYSINDLTHEEKTIYKGIHSALEGKDKEEFTVDSYVQQLKAIGAK